MQILADFIHPVLAPAGFANPQLPFLTLPLLGKVMDLAAKFGQMDVLQGCPETLCGEKLALGYPRELSPPTADGRSHQGLHPSLRNAVSRHPLLPLPHHPPQGRCSIPAPFFPLTLPNRASQQQGQTLPISAGLTAGCSTLHSQDFGTQHRALSFWQLILRNGSCRRQGPAPLYFPQLPLIFHKVLPTVPCS